LIPKVVITEYTWRLKPPVRKTSFLYICVMKTKTIYVVSGMMRAGTSMLMQMLERGGLEVVVDEIKKANQYNPNGYYEHRRIMSVNRQTPVPYPDSFIEKLEGKCIKVYAGYLSLLPMEDFQYKIVLVERELEEIWTSRKKMRKQQLGSNDTTFFPVQRREKMKRVIESVKKWDAKRDNVEILYVNYKAIIENPLQQAQKIKAFLQHDLDEGKMAAAVAPELYKEKASKLFLKTDRSPLAVAKLIDKYAAGKIYCEIGIGEGHNLNAVSQTKKKFGIEMMPYGVQRCKELYPHLQIIRGNYLNLCQRYKFDVCFMWIVYPICRDIVEAAFKHNKNATILMGLNYYYHLPDGDEKKNMYINAYPKQAEADKWNQYIDQHLAELKTQQFQYKIEQVHDENGEIFSVAVIQNKKSNTF